VPSLKTLLVEYGIVLHEITTHFSSAKSLTNGSRITRT